MVSFSGLVFLRDGKRFNERQDYDSKSTERFDSKNIEIEIFKILLLLFMFYLLQSFFYQFLIAWKPTLQHYGDTKNN